MVQCLLSTNVKYLTILPLIREKLCWQKILLRVASITIDDVVYVVDCGKAKETSYDALNKLVCLLPSWISRASAPLNDGLIEVHFNAYTFHGLKSKVAYKIYNRRGQR